MEEKDIRILVVDDVPAMRRIIRGMLHGLGYSKIEEAENGLSALEKLKSAPFDLVITDWNMPVMGGSEFLRSVREDPELRALAVLVVTAEKDNLGESLKNGADGCLLKPFDAAMLAEGIGRVMKKRG